MLTLLESGNLTVQDWYLAGIHQFAQKGSSGPRMVTNDFLISGRY